MKKQIKSVSNWSVKGIITVTILSAMLCTFGAKAINKPSLSENNYSEAMQPENVIEDWMNSETYWGAPSEIAEVELSNSISQWMVSGSYWGIGTQLRDETENLSEIEPWMNSNRYWGGSITSRHMKKTLPIESWMTSTSYWVNGDQTENQKIEQSDKSISRCSYARICNL